MSIKSIISRLLPWLFLAMAFYAFGTMKVSNQHKNKYIWSDAEGYYMYLPAVFIFGFENYPVRTKDHYKPYPGTNKIFTKYTYGVALFQAPFFGIAYLSRIIQGKDPTIIESNDYGMTQLLGACLFGALGLMLLYHALCNLLLPVNANTFSIKLAIASLTLGTNLLFYITRAPVMSHVYSFFLVSAIMYLSPKIWEHSSLKYFGWMGFLIGLLVLIRPISIVVILYPLFHGVSNKNLFLYRMKQLYGYIPKLAFAVGIAFVVWLPQLAYWKYLSGNWFLYSYKNEGFALWDDPQIFYLFFSPLNGWLTFNPVNILAIIGFFPLYKCKGVNSRSIFAIFGISVYLFSSWWMWWFGGSYGLRSFVDILPILAVPMAVGIHRICKKNQLSKVLCLLFIILACIYNIVLAYSYEPFWSETWFDWDDYAKIIKERFWL